MYKVCAYAICKNEIKNIRRWLSCVKEADEVVVLDTGSTDGTWEVLRASGVRCYRKVIHPFRFDVARNEALALVPEVCEICLPLDIDMILPAGWAETLRREWRAGLYTLEIPQYFKAENRAGVWYAHRRHDVAWHYPVYEQLKGEGARKSTAHTLIIHDYDPKKGSHAMYPQLAELGVAENPNDPYCKIMRARFAKERKELSK